jgi:glucose/arabinose dehydrogenase
MSTPPQTPPVLELTEVAGGFNFPTSITVDDNGTWYVAESGLPFGGAPPGGRVLRLNGDERTVLLDGLKPPVNGLTYHDGYLYVTEGGHPARISRLPIDGGEAETVLDGLPGPGNYQTNMVAFGPDGKLYFSQGAMTNTGIIGLDAYDLGWLKRLPHEHDLPGLEVELRGVSMETTDPFNEGGHVTTGAFTQFGTVQPEGTRVPAALPCTSAVMRSDPDGSNLELVAWGVRNGFGLLFLPDGRLICTDQGSDDRGSRPVGNVPELMYEIIEGRWYGWPDFIGGVPISDPRFKPEVGEAPEFILSNHDELPAPEPAVLEITTHAAACKMANTPDGRIVIALFGDEIPMVAPSGPKAGRALGVVDPSDWSYEEIKTPDLKRPIDVKFDADGDLYVLDFGLFEPTKTTMEAIPGSGGIWKAPRGLF